MLSQINTSLWVQEGDVHEHQGLGHEQAAAMGMLPTMGHGAGDQHNNQHLLPMPSGGGGGFGAPLMLPEDNWYLDQGAVGDAAGNGSMVLPPPAMEASGSSSGFGDGSQVFPLLDPGVGGTGPLDVSEFDLDIPGVGSGDFSAFLGAGNASNASLLPHGDAEFLRPFGGFGTAPPAQPTDFGGLAGYDLSFDTGAGGWSGPSSEGPAAPASLAAPFSGQGNAAVLRPLENLPASGAQPTLYQKRALRRNAGEEGDGRKRKAAAVASASALSVEPDIMILDDADDGTISIDGSGLNYDSEEGRDVEESAREDGKESNANSTVTGGAAAEGKRKKKKGMPAKNLMAERRRRKKLNDRLYMLRSVVPRMSKMDRASILGDAADYLKELTQKINDLQVELESSPSTSSLPPTPTSFHPPTLTMAGLPSHVKEELTSPTAQQPRVVVGLREDRAVNIHMLCPRRPGLVHSAMKALEGLGLDVQQAVISYFNEFTLDVFKAECKDGPGPQPEEIKAVLMQSAGFQPAA